MKRLALTAITALSIALTPATAPAESRLEGQEILGLLLGLGALAAIVNEVRDRDEVRPATRTYRAPIRQSRLPAPVYEEFWYDRQERRKNQRFSRHTRLLPSNCIRPDVTLRNSRVLGDPCLRRFDVQTRRLPEQCRHRVNTRSGWRTVFRVRCLRKSGYEVARLNY